MKRQSKAQKDQWHHIAVVSPKQIERMKTGRIESKPSDYENFGSAADRRLRAVRNAIEDRKMLREIERGGSYAY